MSFEDHREMIQSVINDSVDRFAGLAGGFIGAMIALNVGTRVFAKIVPEESGKNFTWSDLALATGVFGAITVGGAVAGASIAAKLIEKV